MSTDGGKRMDELFDAEVQDVLRTTFYEAPGRAEAPTRARPRNAKKKRRRKKKPDHYEVICISMYKEDLARLDEKVRKLKENGHRKMSRSALIRFALDQVETSALPRSY